MDSLLALVGGTSAAPKNVVRRGLVATPGAGLQVSVSAGELMQFVAGATDNQSEYKLGVLEAAASAVIGANASGNPRIDRISATISFVDDDTEVRNIQQLPSRSVLGVSVPTTKTPSIALTVTAGTPGATPLPPATPAGKVALWDVLVPDGAAAITDNFLMDLRVPFEPAALTGEHFVERGLAGSGDSTGTNVIVTGGRGRQNGALINLPADISRVATAIKENGSPALAADQLWHLYAIAVGFGGPVGKNVAQGVVLVLSQTAPTDGTDTPSGALTYAPLQNIAGGSAVLNTTSTALYLTSLRTDSAGGLEFGGVVANRDGRETSPVTMSHNGKFAAWSGWIKKPRLGYVDANTVSVSWCSCVVNGIPTYFPAANASFASNLFAGDARTTSTFYYVYLRLRQAASAPSLAGAIRGAPRSLRLFISSSPPDEIGLKAAADVGFTRYDYLFLGSFWNDAGNVVRAFTREGAEVLWHNMYEPNSGASIALATGPAVTLSPAFAMPATSRVGIGHLSITCAATAAGAASFTFQLFRSSVASAWMKNAVSFDAPNIGSPMQVPLGQFRIPLDSALKFEMNKDNLSNISGASALLLGQTGYVEDIEGFIGT